MLKKIFLIRHAEASSPDGSMKDFDRPLTPAGTRDATHLGLYLAKKNLLPDVFLSSSSLRTTQTAEEIAIQLRFENKKISFKDRLYEPSVRELLAEINQISQGETAMLVTHNPSVTYLAEYLSGDPIGNMSPGTCIEIDFAVENWNEISENTGEISNIYNPRG
ncbi:MAG: histidine phosphatase family protein [Cyclobacteriaceae bacterium]